MHKVMPYGIPVTAGLFNLLMDCSSTVWYNGFGESHEISHTRLLPMTVTQEVPTVADNNHHILISTKISGRMRLLSLASH